MSRFSARQFAAIALCAGLGPALIVGGTLGWTGALLGAALGALLWFWLLRGLDTGLAGALDALPGGKCLLVLYYIWSAFLLGWLIQLCEASFPETTVFPVLPAALLALAWWASTGGAARLGRVCGILAAALLALFAAPLLAGCFTADWQIGAPAPRDLAGGAALLLAPMLALFTLDDARTRPKAWWTLPLAAALTLCAAVCRGVLGAGSRRAASALYEMTKSVSLGGVMERFEALVSVALAASLFCALALVFAAIDKLRASVLPHAPDWPARLIAALAGAAVWWVPQPVSGRIAQIGCLLFGAVLPTLAIFGRRAKKL